MRRRIRTQSKRRTGGEPAPYDAHSSGGPVPLVAVVGRANVGKSTLFNRLLGRQVAVTSPIAGTTRDRVSADLTWRGESFTLIDTGGLDVGPGSASLEKQVLGQARAALDGADLVLFIIDARDGVTPVDRRVARELRKRRADVLLVASKAEVRGAVDVDDLTKLGFGEAVLVSGTSGVGTGDLLDVVHERLAATAPQRAAAPVSRRPLGLRLAFVGRPNVGKSSIVNALLGQERVIVSEIPGTTRDTTSSLVEHQGKPYVLLDTAGLVRPARAKDLARYASIRTVKSLRNADVGVLVLDGNEQLAAADKRAARHLLDANRPIVVAVNKVDLLEKSKHDELAEYVRAMLPLLSWAQVVLISAKENVGLDAIYAAADEAHANFEKTIDPEELYPVVTKIKKHFVARAKGPKSATLYDLRQVKVAPPTFVASVDEVQAVHFSYLRFVENRLRDEFDLSGTPLQIVVRKGILRRP